MAEWRSITVGGWPFEGSEPQECYCDIVNARGEIVQTVFTRWELTADGSVVCEYDPAIQVPAGEHRVELTHDTHTNPRNPSNGGNLC